MSLFPLRAMDRSACHVKREILRARDASNCAPPMPRILAPSLRKRYIRQSWQLCFHRSFRDNIQTQSLSWPERRRGINEHVPCNS
jgi:hypothetical protein